MSLTVRLVTRSVHFHRLLTNATIRKVVPFTLESLNMSLHTKARSEVYPRSDDEVKRCTIEDDDVPWSVDLSSYAPTKYTSSGILAGPSYADPDLSETFTPSWNQLDGNVDRQSHDDPYEVVDGIPRNSHGRTGIAGRGCLGRWGPNHAADPIVTRWKLNEDGSKVINESSGKPILQFVSIQRKDCGEWAIPGGMVDPGEKVSTTLKREFQEEALNALEMSSDDKREAELKLDQLFSEGSEVYAGYVDDPRNTDNAWMETVAYNFHEDDTSGILYTLQLEAGDDAQAVTWTDISADLNLYASHRDFIEKLAIKHDSHW